MSTHDKGGEGMTVEFSTWLADEFMGVALTDWDERIAWEAWSESRRRYQAARPLSAVGPKLSFMGRMALVSARDYLMWLVELNGIKKGAVQSVRDLIDKAIAEDDALATSAIRDKS